MKKIVFLSIIFTFSINVFTKTKNECPQTNKYFIIDSVVKKETFAGMIGGISTVTYELYITVKNKKFKGIDSAWAKEQAAISSLKLPVGTSLKDFKVKKKGKYNYMTVIRYQANTPAEAYYPTIKKPVNCQQELIISYKVGKKKYYLTIKDFKVRESINLP